MTPSVGYEPQATYVLRESRADVSLFMGVRLLGVKGVVTG